jgi:hypothetical protein
MPSLNQTNVLSFAPQVQAASRASSASAATTSGGNWDLTFHNLLGIINPLQHLPVVGTLYRAITGDTIGTPEKIAGDALYGGLWGAASSVADTAFEAATGKNFGDTVLGMVFGDHDKPAAVAANDAAPAAAHKSFGDRMLAMLFDNHADTASVAIAANSVVTPAIQANDTAPAGAASATAATTPSTPDVVALTSALAQKGIDSNTAQRALMAYRRSQAPQSASTGALLAVAQ